MVLETLETYDWHKDEEEQNRKKFLTKENVDWDFCDGCQYRFKPLLEQEKYCRECIFYLLQED